MLTKISPHPLYLAGTRVVEHLNTETGSERVKEMIFHYEMRVHENDAEDSKELVIFRRTDKLTATNDTKVDAQGKILTPDAIGGYPENAIGEWDFYTSAMFSGNFTKEEMIKMVILRADERKQFD